MNISLSWLTQTDYNMNGKNLILKVNGTAVAAAKSCSIDTKCDLLEVSSPSDGAWRRFWVGRKEWSVSCSYLLTYENLTGVLGIVLDLEDAIPEEITELANKRAEAKKAKDYAEADRIRDEIQSKGYVVKDVPGGFKIEKAN